MNQILVLTLTIAAPVLGLVAVYYLLIRKKAPRPLLLVVAVIFLPLVLIYAFNKRWHSDRPRGIRVSTLVSVFILGAVGAFASLLVQQQIRSWVEDTFISETVGWWNPVTRTSSKTPTGAKWEEPVNEPRTAGRRLAGYMLYAGGIEESGKLLVVLLALRLYGFTMRMDAFIYATVAALGDSLFEDTYHYFAKGPNPDQFLVIFAHSVLCLGWVVGLSWAKGRPGIIRVSAVLLGLLVSAALHGLHDFLVDSKEAYPGYLHVCLILLFWIAYAVVGVVVEQCDSRVVKTAELERCNRPPEDETHQTPHRTDCADDGGSSPNVPPA